MEKQNGIYVNGGSFRPKWLRKNQSRSVLHFSFSLEVPCENESAASLELCELVHSLVSDWSRKCYVQRKKEETERKRGKECQK